MALLSGYFDTLLSTGMKETESRKVILEDVEPETYELAMDILENPKKCNRVTPAEIVQVLPFYDRFDFSSGLELSESVLTPFLKQYCHEEPSKRKNPTVQAFRVILDAISIVFSHKANLDELVGIGVEFLTERFGTPGGMGMGLFRCEHIEHIQDFLSDHPECLESFTDELEERITDAMPDMDCPTYPRWLSNTIATVETVSVIRRSILPRVHIELSVDTSRIQGRGGGLQCSKHVVSLECRSHYGIAELHFGCSNNSGYASLEHSTKGDHSLTGSTGVDFEDGDWVLNFSLPGGFWWCSFVFPGSSHHLWPPTGAGWLELFQDDDDDDDDVPLRPTIKIVDLQICRG